MSIWNIGKDDVPEHIQALKNIASSKGGTDYELMHNLLNIDI
jgi:hypothetical protein